MEKLINASSKINSGDIMVNINDMISTWKKYVDNKVDEIKATLRPETQEAYEKALILARDLIDRRNQELESVKNSLAIKITLTEAVRSKNALKTPIVISNPEPYQKLCAQRAAYINKKLPKVQESFIKHGAHLNIS